MGGDVMVYNLKGVASGAITLTGPQIADIYLGKIKKWNDPVLAKQNPGVKLPDQAISVVHRSDGSGTTFIFTNYLSTVSADGKTSWPMTGASFILMHKQQPAADAAKEVLRFFDWSFNHGDAMARELDYVPIPDSVVSLIRAAWKREIKDAAGKPVY